MMLTPTHIQVAVLRTKDLVIKGKNGTNDAYIIFSLGKEKFQSSIMEKSTGPILEWNEGCDIAIPSSQGNKAELVLKVFHKASMGDKFLGRLALPLSEFDVMAKPKAIWYKLKPKSGNEKDTKYRGEIEVRIKFLIKSSTNLNLTAESAHDLAGKSKRNSFRSSLGSILSLGKKKKKKDKSGSGSSKETVGSSNDSLRKSTVSSSRLSLNNNLPIINDDPGVISEEDDIESPPIEFKIDRKKSTQSGVSALSSSYSDKLNSSSLPSTPKNVQKSGLRDIFTDSADSPPPILPEFKVEPSSIEDDAFNEQAQMSPKPRVVRLPSVIVEEPSAISGESKGSVSSSVPTNSFTTPNVPPKLTVSASMINLSVDGKGSVRKTFKSMFTPSKHLSVDEIFRSPDNSSSGGAGGNATGEERSRTSSNQSEHSSIFPGGFMMKKRNSVRDLKIPKETFKLYERKSKEELVAIIINLQETADAQKLKINDLEDYIDKLLLRVLDKMPCLLKKGNSVRAE